MPSIINTIFPVKQGFDTVPSEVKPPYSPGPGVPSYGAGEVDAGDVAPGLGVPTTSTIRKLPASVADPNIRAGGRTNPGVGVADDSPEDDANAFSGDGPITVKPVGTALGTIAGGLLSPGGVPVSVVQNTIANQVLGVGTPQNVRGGIH